MPFTAGLRESLQVLGDKVPSEFTRGDSLETVLTKHLLAVEQSCDRDLFTSILLLSPDGKRLSHGAAPNLPKVYREAIDGTEIGPRVGSCGTAAFFGRPVYVTDIETDPLWAEYRHLALPHGLRSCWSTPIRDLQGSVIGTFAIYHRTSTGPTREEVEAIEMITEHVARAIMWSRGIQDLGRPESDSSPRSHGLRLVGGGDPVEDAAGLLANLRKLEALAEEMDRQAREAESSESKAGLSRAAEDTRALIQAIQRHIEDIEGSGL